MKVEQSSSSGRTTRRKILKYGLYAGLAARLSPSLWLSGCRRPSRRKKQLSVLIICLDTLRADYVSCYGYKQKTTPNIDRLAMRGHRFSEAYTVMPTTLPAHASLFTSLYPTQHTSRRNGQELPDGLTTVAEIFQSAGYATAGFVSTYILDERYGLNRGFQTYDGVGDEKERPATKTLGKATRWLRTCGDRPYFLFVHLYDPHTPYYAPKSFRKLFKAPKSSMPSEKAFLKKPADFTPGVVRKVIAAYSAEIAYADWAVGRLMEKLDRLELAETTLVILLSDHGESLGELITRYGYAFDHGEFLYGHQLRIPLIIQIPSWVCAEQSLVHTTQVSILDVMPTILEILEVEPPGFMVGESLLGMLRGEKMSHGPIFSERRVFQKPAIPYLAEDAYSIIEGQWHRIHSGRGVELYDLGSDPEELRDLGPQHEKCGYLDRKLREHFNSLKPLFGPSKFETDAEALQRLRSLGYTK